MASFLSDDQLAAIAKAEASLTHRDPLAGEVSAAVVRLARALIRGTPWADALALAARGRHPRIQEALRPARRQDLSAGGFAPDVLQAAVHFLSTSPTLAVALERAVEFAGLSNFCPVLVGSVGGAWAGRRSIPEEALSECDVLKSVRSAANVLLEGWKLER
jgi:ADP-ribosylglycohydrolase